MHVLDNFQNIHKQLKVIQPHFGTIHVLILLTTGFQNWIPQLCFSVEKICYETRYSFLNPVEKPCNAILQYFFRVLQKYCNTF